jgi:hypothetical protein
MKRIKITVLFISLWTLSNSQTISNNQIELFGGFSFKSIYRYHLIANDIYYDNNNSFQYGINYAHTIDSTSFSIISGITYFNFNTKKYNERDYPQSVGYPFELTIIQIPMHLRYNFNTWLYIESGVLFDYQINKNTDIANQTGFGFCLAAGINWRIAERLYLNFKPEFGLTSLVPLYHNNFQYHLSMESLNLGIGYCF